jgi:hypothetical protein
MDRFVACTPRDDDGLDSQRVIFSSGMLFGSGGAGSCRR